MEPLNQLGQYIYDGYVWLDSIDPIQAVAISAIVWIAQLAFGALVYPFLSSGYRKLDIPKRGDYLSRVNSNVHAFHAAFTALYVLLYEHDLYEGKGFSMLSFWRGSMLLTLGYFVSDAILVTVLFKTIGSPAETLAHHFCAGLTSVFVLQEGTSYFAYIWLACVTTTELSTCWVNLRWFVSLEYRDTVLYTIIGMSMMVIFLIVRLGIFPYFLLWMFRNEKLSRYGLPSTPRESLILGSVGMTATMMMMILNLYWSYLMVRAAMRILKPSKKVQSDSAPKIETSQALDAKKDL